MSRDDMAEALAAELRTVVGAEHVLTDPDLRASYEVDWTRRFEGSCDMVVRPADTAEVGAVLAACSAAGAVVVPQGGNTGLVGGSVPGPVTGGPPVVILSTRRLNAVGPVDVVAGQVVAGGGATLAQLEDAVAATPWRVGVDFGARDTATVGGMVATNAGGARVVRYGMMRANVAGVEAVLADGTVLSHLAGLQKDNTGYDLASLLCGSEGTLAIVTAVRVRLVPADDAQSIAWVGCDSWSDAVALATSCRLRLRTLDGIEAVDGPTQRLVADALRLPPPIESQVALLVVLATDDGPDLDALGELVGERPVAVALDRPGALSLWERRDHIAEALATIGVPHKFDVSVPIDRIAAFTAELPAAVGAAAPDAGVYVFGHLGDGNLHVNVVGPAPGDDAVDDAVLLLVAANGGSISAEHGIGRAKQRWLHLSRTPEELRAFRAIKAALDPAGILNPGAGPVLP
jgi:FAD/FMN-containing dehydrogenase